MPALSDSDLQDIQGIGLAGFRKDFQELIAVSFGDPKAALVLLGYLAERTANSWEVRGFNAVFSEIAARCGEGVIEATWVGTAISAAGYTKLGVDLSTLGSGAGFDAFRSGMATRSSQIGDSHPQDAPANWLPPFRPGAGVDLLIVVASDSESALDRECDVIAEKLETAGCQADFQERGATLPEPLTGHEHFGFKDGVSQPSVDGFDPAPEQGEPPAVAPGEFVLGYPDQAGATAQVPAPWQHGSFLVFRRLAQDVAGFRNQVQAMLSATNPTLGADQLSAELADAGQVGRRQRQPPAPLPILAPRRSPTPSATRTTLKA